MKYASEKACAESGARHVLAIAAGIIAVLVAGKAMAATPSETCEAGKNGTAGKYAACLQKAQSKFVASGTTDTMGLTDAITRCGLQYASGWDKAETKAGTGVCPRDGDAPDIQGFLDACLFTAQDAIGGAVLPLDVTACNAELSLCKDQPFGTATLGDVLAGKTFSSSAGLGVTGAMANNGAVMLTPTTSDQTIAAGYHNGLGKCAGDADLVAAKVLSGVNLFGVTGAVVQATGTATAGNVLSGVTFSNASGSGTGTMANNGAVAITPGTTAQVIAAGYHNGSGTVAGDTDLVAGNIVSGKNIFGVTGTATAGSGTITNGLLKTGQTTSYGAGSDGDLQKGTGQSFTDNGDGTITDNRTGLMWEKKSNNGDIHDWDNTYTWGSGTSPYSMNGTMVTTFLAALNAGTGFAGYTDWRIPNRNELLTLVNLEAEVPATFSVFHTGCIAGASVISGSCTQSDPYWSSTTYQLSPNSAWFVNFYAGDTLALYKTNFFYVRAVRAGS